MSTHVRSSVYVNMYCMYVFIFTCLQLLKRVYSKTCLKQPLPKRPKMGFQYQLLLTAGQKYCRMLQREHSAILSPCIKLPHGFKTFVLSIFEWPLKTGFTVFLHLIQLFSVFLTLKHIFCLVQCIKVKL